ncbi:MAG: TetR family transcriptional regulator [Mycobacterium sp.]|nr:TetR family transcriptional regulator [Mycobacterium sp.]
MTGQKPDPTGAKILDGAVRVLGDFGVKRATVELVAKYAGVSHMTIYRRWPSKNELLSAALTGAFSTLLDAAFAPSEEPDGSYADRALEAFTDTVWAVQSHPIVLRELNTDAGEQSPILTSASGGVMAAGIPLIAERLRRLATTAEDAPADLDPVADMFVRLGYSLVAVKRPDRPLTSREQVAQYAAESFGPYLQAITPKTAPTQAAAASVVELAEQRPPKVRPYRLTAQIAAASVLSVLTLGAGLTAVIGGSVTLPFVSPANVDKPTTTPASPGLPPENPGTPADSGQQHRPVAPSETPIVPAESPGAPAESPIPAALSPRSPVEPPPAAIPQIAPVQRPAAAVGSVGGNSGPDSNPIPRNPAPGPQPVPVPVVGTQPAAPKPQPPAPQPKTPSPQPKPPPPQPKPPAPQPKPPSPKPPPKQSDNGGKQHQSGSGHQSNRQHGSSN